MRPDVHRAISRIKQAAAPIAAGTHWRLRNLDSGVPVLRSGLQVLTVEETLQRIIVDGRSVARFGDGELRLATRALGIGFQASSPALASALAEVARTQDPRLEVCVPGIFGSLKEFTPEAQLIWRKHLLRERGRRVRMFGPAVTYGNAFLSRPYIDWEDKTLAGHRFALLKRVWEDRDVVVIEGAQTRMGVGNDLLARARSVERIVAPATDAWGRRNEILEAAAALGRDRLLLLALGPTATVLARDLCLIGFQAIDIGHVDVEYEWFLAGASSKTPIAGKHVNEAGGVSGVTIEDSSYQRQVIARIE